MRHREGLCLALGFSKVGLWMGRRWWGSLATHLGAKWSFVSRPRMFFPIPTWTAEADPPAPTSSHHHSAWPFQAPQINQPWHRLPRQHAAGGEEQISDTHFGSGAKAVPSPSLRLRRSRTNCFKGRLKGKGRVGFWVSAFHSTLQSRHDCHSRMLQTSLSSWSETWLHGDQGLMFNRV